MAVPVRNQREEKFGLLLILKDLCSFQVFKQDTVLIFHRPILSIKKAVKLFLTLGAIIHNSI